MAELNTENSEKNIKVRSKKSNGKVDLTAMVDLAFLLITFFMLTTSLTKPQSMDLVMPDDVIDTIKTDEHQTMTILIGDNNKLMYYMGQFITPLEAPSEIKYGKAGIRTKLLEKVKSVPFETNRGLICVIKASKNSSYKNLVDVLDEMAICKVPTYAVVKLEKEEEALLER